MYDGFVLMIVVHNIDYSEGEGQKKRRRSCRIRVVRPMTSIQILPELES